MFNDLKARSPSFSWLFTHGWKMHTIAQRHLILYQAERTGKRWYHFWLCNFIWKAKGFLELPFDFRNSADFSKAEFTPLLARLGKQNTWEYLVFPSHRCRQVREKRGMNVGLSYRVLPQWKPGNTKNIQECKTEYNVLHESRELLQTVV